MFFVMERSDKVVSNMVRYYPLNWVKSQSIGGEYWMSTHVEPKAVAVQMKPLR